MRNDLDDSRSNGIWLNGRKTDRCEVPPKSTDFSFDDTVINTIILIEQGLLFRQMLEKCLGSEFAVASFSSPEQWLNAPDAPQATIVALSIHGKLSRSEHLQRDIDSVLQARRSQPLIIIGDDSEPAEVVEMLEKEVRGYVPTSLSLDSVVEAFRFVKAGGTFAPASSLIAAIRKAARSEQPKPRGTSIFTTRQIAVVDALRRGKANKVIAYELKMREGTVKVHIRNIMKKLKARNRTEVAFLTREIVA